ncbi:DNA topoisomerase [Moraxella canis]|uniref:DNA topoisomerase n=1 Tax=Moraxella canis TaxID=90239 RepID=UPI000669A388|nr:DNA topoisomerase [Moraxella canis]
MNNSAHDDISIIGDYLQDGFRHDQDLQKIYKLIYEMQKSELLGDAKILHQKLKLQQLDDQNTFIEFDVNSVLSQGWLAGYIGSFASTHFSEELSSEDIDAIANNDFSLQISLHEESSAIQLDALIDKMDTYEIGRPSTAATTLEKMMADQSLLMYSNGEVSLTEEGKEVLKKLKKHFGDIANIGWNLKFSAELMDISDGSLPPDHCLFSIFESMYGTEDKEKIKHLGWTNPDVLHEELDNSNQVRLGGFISIGERYRGQ